MPRPACCASLVACTLVSRALVATTTSVVLRRRSRRLRRASSAPAVSANSRLSGVLRAPATILPVAGSRTSPNAFTTARLRHQHAARQRHRERADARFHGLPHAQNLADGGAGARAHRAFLHGVGGGGRGGGFAHGRGGPHVGFADGQDRRGWPPARCGTLAAPVSKPTPCCSR